MTFLFQWKKNVLKKGAKPRFKIQLQFVLERLKICAILLSGNISRTSALVPSKEQSDDFDSAVFGNG